MENMMYLFTSFLSCLIVLGLLFQFMGERWRKASDSRLLYWVAWLLASGCISLVNLLRSPLLNMGANLVVFTMISLLLYRDRAGRKYWRVLEADCFFSVVALFEAVGVFGLDFLLVAVGWMPENTVWLGSMEELFSKVVLVFAYYLLMRRFWKKGLGQNRAQLVLYLVMFLYSVFYFLITFYLADSVLLREHYSFLWVVTGIAAFVSMYFLYFMRVLDGKHELDLRLAMMKQQEEMQFNYYRRQQEQYRKSVAILHDVSRHIRSIENLYQTGEGEQALRYTKEIDSILKPLVPVEYSDNPMLNILLTDKKLLAEQEGIRFNITVQCSGLEFIEPVDVTVLFANLLDNAMEACRQCKAKKEIHVSIRSYNEMVSIRIENTVGKEVRFSPEGRPIRENGKQGGIGILNVEKCVEKYGGNVLYRQENGKLYSDVLLNR